EVEPEWTLALFLEELAALRETLGLERVHLLGTSWGGMLALEHALAHQETLHALVLSSTMASAAEWEVEVKRLRDALGTDDEDEAMSRLAARHIYRRDGEPSELRRMRAEPRAEVYEAMWGPNEWTVSGSLRGWDVRARLGEIQVPTLVLRGAHDLSTPAVASTIVKGIPHAHEVVFAESSHMPVLEETERYLAAVREFLYAVEAR
ncbi:MAG: proline iminopeptidase, partial [Gaiellaceae bacterium]|nr:proline iminopeptidase [Gaiellaceae bacterium]